MQNPRRGKSLRASTLVILFLKEIVLSEAQNTQKKLERFDSISRNWNPAWGRVNG
jgi:hypothetical protein